MKRVLSALILILLPLLSVGVAQGQQSVYEGESYYGNWVVYTADGIDLGDGSGENMLWLGGTLDWCYTRGSTYATMNQYVLSNWPDDVSWWVDETCWHRGSGSHLIRVCVESSRGASVCSTYRDLGWHHWSRR